jgi:septal ring factor EnvC (AmiA/AmiB activator)
MADKKNISNQQRLNALKAEEQSLNEKLDKFLQAGNDRLEAKNAVNTAILANLAQQQALHAKIAAQAEAEVAAAEKALTARESETNTLKDLSSQLSEIAGKDASRIQNAKACNS